MYNFDSQNAASFNMRRHLSKKYCSYLSLSESVVNNIKQTWRNGNASYVVTQQESPHTEGGPWMVQKSL